MSAAKSWNRTTRESDIIRLINTTLSCALSLVLAAASFAAEAPIPVIFDMDISTDCDVVGAVACLVEFEDGQRSEVQSEIERMMQRGCGIVCVHYATALLGQDVAADGDHPLLQWMGGYFANKTCPHHPDIARIFEAATIEPAAPQHPISRGWSEFTLHDEPYINNYFGKNDNQPAANVTPLATSMLPPENPQPEIVSW